MRGWALHSTVIMDGVWAFGFGWARGPYLEIGRWVVWFGPDKYWAGE